MRPADRLKKIDSGYARAVRPACQHAFGPPSGGRRGWDRRPAPIPSVSGLAAACARSARSPGSCLPWPDDWADDDWATVRWGDCPAGLAPEGSREHPIARRAKAFAASCSRAARGLCEWGACPLLLESGRPWKSGRPQDRQRVSSPK
jgi:hypothetical protein